MAMSKIEEAEGLPISLWKVELERVDREEGLETESLKANYREPFPDPDQWLEGEPKRGLVIRGVDAILGWGRSYSLWPVNSGLACCALEMIACAVPRFDLARFGMELFRASPRQADLLLVAGTLTWKMATKLKRIYEQMPEPKWVLAMGSCAISGGTFAQSYSVVPGVNRIVPVDIYVPGCPPHPQGLLYGILQLHEKIRKTTLAKRGEG